MLACCPTGTFIGDLDAWVTRKDDGSRELDLIVPDLDSPRSIPVIERALEALPGIASARVNLTGKRVIAAWHDDDFRAGAIAEKLEELGFQSRPFDPTLSGLAADDAESKALLRAVAVSGFAAANIMLLSVSVWSGAEAATRDLFHWVSAMIALPTVCYAGRPFFRGAARALAAGHFNMDVPISLAVCLAALMSLFETINGGEVAYFDASVTLLFFLLTGRYLDHLMRARARSAVSRLLALKAQSAMVEAEDGGRRMLPTGELRPGMTMLVAVGERLAADGFVVGGRSEIDRSLVTGESTPEAVAAGALVHAGMLNLTGPLTVRITAAGKDTFLSEIVQLMESAEAHRSHFVRVADRLARIYSPAVHILALTTLLGWLAWTGGDWHTALMAAIATLIITCPCALGLAVPAVQTIASGALFRDNVMIKDGAALEKLAQIDTVIFDKTGTLTLGRPRLADAAAISPDNLALAAGLAQASRHPLSRAVCEAAQALGIQPVTVEDVREHPGQGLSGSVKGKAVRLGSRAWCGLGENRAQALPEFALSHDGRQVVFTFEDALRPDAIAVVARLKAQGLHVEILSGDRAVAVERAALALDIDHWRSGLTPQDKLAAIQSLRDGGAKVLMVGDGLNDAPALAAGHTSIAPSSAADIGQTAADTVFMGEGLAPVVIALDVARRANRLMLQNFILAIGYNAFAVPIAMLGLASPLIAAVAMSTSSILVVANSLRLSSRRRAGKARAPAALPSFEERYA